jgi:hypothetical protein
MALGALALLAASPVCAQYLGQLTKQAKDAPELRAIAVLEWTGPEGKPKASRLVPVAVLDSARIEGGQLQDGGIYLARPEPLALTGEVEYELERNGKPMGLFEIENAGQEQGSWVGYGAWKPLPAVRPKPSTEQLANVGHDDEESDQPVLHRKKHPGDAPTGDKDKTSSGGAGSGNGSSSEEPAPDPDRPVLHKKDSNGSAASSPAPADDPDRPVLKKTKKKQPEDVAHVDSLPDITDPDRPRLRRGQATGDALSVVPSLMGLPPDLEQAVAVSDAKSRPPHPWSYSWSDQDDEAKMKSELEEIARDALGLNPPPAPKQAARRKQAGKGAKPAPPPPASAPLVDEQFRVFELAYGSGATLVLTAHIDAPRTQMKFVTLIAQPDLYGNVLVLLKSVADGGHLDEAPRMRLVDAVDALADNRGELLFELRGATQRQFALYRILRGQAEKLFVTGGGEFGSESRE